MSVCYNFYHPLKAIVYSNGFEEAAQIEYEDEQIKRPPCYMYLQFTPALISYPLPQDKSFRVELRILRVTTSFLFITELNVNF